MKYFVEGDTKRTFLNTKIGCDSKCKYCYLPELDFGASYKKTVRADLIIEYLEKKNNFIKGKAGTVFSIGCYSECWDKTNQNETKNLLNQILKWGNPVQMATKKEVKFSSIESISKQVTWKNQLSIFVSCPTISYSEVYEQGVDKPSKRFKTFEACSKLKIPSILYIKPVLESITINDIDKYTDLIDKYNMAVVVGNIFSTTPLRDKAPVGQGQLFILGKNEEQVRITNEISKHTKVYSNSIDIVNHWRER